ncbi:MAG: hypothetical protein Q9222_003717, partial [Ikaeria aurantiellina]
MQFKLTTLLVVVAALSLGLTAPTTEDKTVAVGFPIHTNSPAQQKYHPRPGHIPDHQSGALQNSAFDKRHQTEPTLPAPGKHTNERDSLSNRDIAASLQLNEARNEDTDAAPAQPVEPRATDRRAILERFYKDNGRRCYHGDLKCALKLQRMKNGKCVCVPQETPRLSEREDEEEEKEKEEFDVECRAILERDTEKRSKNCKSCTWLCPPHQRSFLVNGKCVCKKIVKREAKEVEEEEEVEMKTAKPHEKDTDTDTAELEKRKEKDFKCGPDPKSK